MGTWQQRFFEASGHYLKYYKAEDRKKLLAAFDLRLVAVEPDLKDDKVEQRTAHCGRAPHTGQRRQRPPPPARR